MNAKAVGSSLLLFLSLAGCGTGSRAICERGDECNLLSGQSAAECTERVDDGLADGRLTSTEVDDCEVCVRNSDRACNEVISDCLRVCGAVFGEIAFGSGGD